MKTFASNYAKGLKPPAQAGVALVEIMVALLLSLILVAGVGQIYISSKQTYRMQDGQSRLQENGRFALQLLTHDIQQAGYLGCQSSSIGAQKLYVIANAPLLAPPSSSQISTPTNVVVASAISGGDSSQQSPAGTFSSPYPAISNPDTTNKLASVVRGTDAITVMFGESCGGVTQAAMSTVDHTTANLVASNTCSFAEGDSLLIADCNSSHVFKSATGTDYNSLNGAATSTFEGNRSYIAGSEILAFHSHTYYIRLNAGNEPALYRFDNNMAAGGNNPVELVEGIEDMQILYGVDTSSPTNGVDFYVTADSVTNWSQVVSVRIMLTARSVGEDKDNLSYAKRTYTFNGSSVTDGRLVKTFSATISLRNRLL
jgi:type IV pilus assembly protein PilW